MCVLSQSVVSNSCDPIDCSLPGESPGRILEWVAISFSRGSSPPRNQTRVSSIGRQVLYLPLVPPGVTGEAFREEVRVWVGDTKLSEQRCPCGLPTARQPRLGIRGRVQGGPNRTDLVGGPSEDSPGWLGAQIWSRRSECGGGSGWCISLRF